MNFAHTGNEFGTVASPFNTLSEGVNNVITTGTVRISPGSSTETPTVSKQVTLQANGGAPQIGVP